MPNEQQPTTLLGVQPEKTGDATQKPDANAAPGAAPTEQPKPGTTPAATVTPEKKDAQQDQKPDATKDGKPEGDKAAPSEIEVKVPDGFQADEAVLKEFKTIAKESGLDSEKSQKLFDLYTKSIAGLDKTRQELWEKTQSGWAEQVKADKEFGGAKLKESLVAAQKAIDRFGGSELRKVLDQSGLGDHPAIFRAFVRAGLAVSEDKLDGKLGDPNATTEFHAVDIYPSMQPKQ